MLHSALHLIAFVACAICANSSAVSCGHVNPPIENRPGLHHSTDVTFAYESRVESFRQYAHSYFWCILNRSSLPIFFRWGTTTDETKYFNSMVIPAAEPMLNWITDSSDFGHDNRVLKFRRLDRPDTPLEWQAIQPQTIYPKESDLIFSKEEDAQLVFSQSNIEQLLNNYKTPQGLIDLVKLSQNRQLFRSYVEREGNVELTQTMVFTLPTNTRALQAIEQGRYENYNPKDFAKFSVIVSNSIKPSQTYLKF